MCSAGEKQGREKQGREKQEREKQEREKQEREKQERRGFIHSSPCLGRVDHNTQWPNHHHGFCIQYVVQNRAQER